MGNLILDFSSVQSNESTLLEEGLYAATIESIENKVSSSGNEMLLIRFREVETKTALFENYPLVDSCLWKIKELLVAAGLDAAGKVDFDTEALIGTVVNLKVIQEEYNGELKNRIKKVFAA